MRTLQPNARGRQVKVVLEEVQRLEAREGAPAPTTVAVRARPRRNSIASKSTVCGT